MAVITQPPVNFNPASPARSGIQFPHAFFGPFEYSAPARLYVVLLDQTTFGLVVYKSTDGGANWVQQDAGNGPLVESGVNNYGVAQRGNILTIVYPPAVYTGQRIVTFDVSTDTFGVPSVAGPSPQTHVAWILQLPSNGDCYVIYRRNTGLLQVLFRTFIAGVWGPEVAITAEALNVSLYQVLLDPDERIHVFYEIAVKVLKTNTVLAGVVGVASVVRNGNSDDIFNEMGLPTIWGTKIVLPYIFDNGGPIDLAAVIVGDDYAGAPTIWDAPLVVDTIPTVTAGGADNECYSLTSLDGTTAYVFWVALDYSSFPNPAGIIDQLWYVQNSGSGWSAPILYYDEQANPQLEDPGQDPFAQDIHTLSIAALSTGVFGAQTALEENSFCAGYFLVEGACDITITVTPHGSAPVTVPNDGTVFALPPAYGLTPYSFSASPTIPSTPNAPAVMQAVEGAGPAQNFEYSIPAGNLPAGMSFGASGGSISGPGSTPVQSDTGMTLGGTPSTNPSGPTTIIVTGKVKLVG